MKAFIITNKDVQSKVEGFVPNLSESFTQNLREIIMFPVKSCNKHVPVEDYSNPRKKIIEVHIS